MRCETQSAEQLSVSGLIGAAAHGRIGGAVAGKIGNPRYVARYAQDSRAKCSRQVGCCRMRAGKNAAMWILKGEPAIVKRAPSLNKVKRKTKHFHPECIFESFRRTYATTKVITSSIDVEGFEDLYPADQDFVNGNINQFNAENPFRRANIEEQILQRLNREQACVDPVTHEVVACAPVPVAAQVTTDPVALLTDHSSLLPSWWCLAAPGVGGDSGVRENPAPWANHQQQSARAYDQASPQAGGILGWHHSVSAWDLNSATSSMQPESPPAAAGYHQAELVSTDYPLLEEHSDEELFLMRSGSLMPIQFD